MEGEINLGTELKASINLKKQMDKNETSKFFHNCYLVIYYTLMNEVLENRIEKQK